MGKEKKKKREPALFEIIHFLGESYHALSLFKGK